MRQILYVSSSAGSADVDLPGILKQSRYNNGIDGITGLLYSDQKRFLQVLEGPEESVETTFRRIKADPRHRAVVVLSDRTVDEREFGDWAMAYRERQEVADAFDARLHSLLSGTSESIRSTFTGLIEARRQA